MSEPKTPERTPTTEADIDKPNEEPTNENILTALKGLLALYEVHCETREKVGDQGVDISRNDTFFEQGRTVRIRRLTLTINSLVQLENLIANYKKKID